jgi:hypothetical protein
LRDDDPAAHAPAGGRGGPGGRTRQRGQHVGAQHLQRGRQSDQDAGGDAERHGEDQHAHVDRYVERDGKQADRPRPDPAGHVRQEQADERTRERQGGKGAGKRQQDRLGQHMARNPRATGTQRQTHADLAAARDATRHQDAGQVDGGDEQHHARDDHQR